MMIIENYSVGNNEFDTDFLCAACCNPTIKFLLAVVKVLLLEFEGFDEF
jgi:hypothetical protein